MGSEFSSKQHTEHFKEQMNSYTQHIKESDWDLRIIWSPRKKRKQSQYVNVGDRVWLYYEYTDENTGEVTYDVHDAVVTQVFLKSFRAVCEGEVTDLVPIDLERTPRRLAGVWKFSDGPIVDEEEFGVFKLLNTCATVVEEPDDLSDVVLTSVPPGAWS
jgi:hypothetical protein